MIKELLFTMIFLCIYFSHSKAQENITNAFDDLKRKGSINAVESEMNRPASDEALNRMLAERPAAGYFCFTEDREHDICLNNTIPQRWAKLPADKRRQFTGECAPGEFYVWQIGVFAPYQSLNNLTVRFSDLKNESGNKIKSGNIQCFNLGGKDTRGKEFHKIINVGKGLVQPLWIGIAIPASAQGRYTGKATVDTDAGRPVDIDIEITVKGNVLENQGDNEGWRKTRLRWLNSELGNTDIPTAPYTPVKNRGNMLSWLGGNIKLGSDGLPQEITTCYNQGNLLDSSVSNHILAEKMNFIIETRQGIETLKQGSLKITAQTPASVSWESVRKNKNFKVICQGTMGFDGISNIQLTVKAEKDIQVKDIRLEIPYTGYASEYMMGLGHKGGFRPDSLIQWQWDTLKHQDKIWMGNVNAGLNFRFRDENYVRPLVNIYYSLGRLHLPVSWGNAGKGGITINAQAKEETRMTAYSGERNMQKGESLHYDFDMQVTPVKPIKLPQLATKRFYHSNSDLSANYIPEALKAGANLINIHHKKEVYPFINYPFYDESLPDLKALTEKAHRQGLGIRLYYTTRELTVKIPELWALRSLGSEIIHDGPGKDTRTLIHRNGPNEWLNKHLTTHFIPAWYNAFKEGKYAGDMDISVITTPDSRWNNYYLAGLDWMVSHLGIDGIYIDDSALDRQTLQRARRILDADGKCRLIDLHSWNHMNQWAGYANSIHLYMELLPYVDRTWIGEGFKAGNTADFWLVEMSGIPFGLLSETLDANNPYRGMIYGMLPRLPWSGNPVPLWQLWDAFGMEKAVMKGYWDAQCPVTTNNPQLPATVYVNGTKALVVIANWSDKPQKGEITLNEQLLGFHPTSTILPEIKNLQSEKPVQLQDTFEIPGKSGWVILLEQ